jgi:hypothetical protein
LESNWSVIDFSFGSSAVWKQSPNTCKTVARAKIMDLAGFDYSLVLGRESPVCDGEIDDALN